MWKRLTNVLYSIYMECFESHQGATCPTSNYLQKPSLAYRGAPLATHDDILK